MNRYLFVIDYQNDFVDGALGFPGAEKLDEKIAAKVRSYGKGHVLFTRDTHFENYMDTREGRFLPVPHCIRGTEGWALEGEIAKECARGMISFEKPTFSSTALMHHVAAAAGAKGCVNGKGMTIELCGVCTDICVVSNALLLKAVMPEVPISVDPSCCAGVTPESHDAALLTMKMCQIEVL